MLPSGVKIRRNKTKRCYDILKIRANVYVGVNSSKDKKAIELASGITKKFFNCLKSL